MGKYTDMIKSKNGINGNFLVEVAKELDSGSNIKQGANGAIANAYKGDHSPNKALFEAIVEEASKQRAVTDLDSTMAEVNRISPMVDDHGVRLDSKAIRLAKVESDTKALAQAIQDLYNMWQQSTLEHAADLHMAGNKLYLKTHEGIIMGNGVTIEGGNTTVIPVTGLSVTPSSVSLSPGATRQLQVAYIPTTTTQVGVNYVSSNNSIVEVTNSGMMTAISSGTASITIRSKENSSIYTTCVVTVAASNLLVTAISPNEVTKDMHIGDTFDLSWTYTPSNATSPSFNVTSDTNCVSISNLTSVSKRITAMSPGLSTITITETKSSVSTTMMINVASDGKVFIDLNGAVATHDQDTGLFSVTSIPTAYHPVFLRDSQGNMARKVRMEGAPVEKATSLYIIVGKDPNSSNYLAMTLGGWRPGAIGNGTVNKWFWHHTTGGTQNPNMDNTTKSIGASVTFELEPDKLIVRGDKGYYEFDFNAITDPLTKEVCLNNQEFGFFLQGNTLPNKYNVIGV